MRQGWLGNKDTVLHSGEGVVSIARWAGKFVAWANDRGVKVIHILLTNSHNYIAYCLMVVCTFTPTSFAKVALSLRKNDFPADL